MEWKPCPICNRGRQALQRYPNEICSECENKEWKPCPICKHRRRAIERYPYALCNICEDKTVTRTGERIHFQNEYIEGGCIGILGSATYSGIFNSEVTRNTTCYVDGVKCFANISSYGGIVVSVDMLVRKIMRKWKRKAKAIGMIMIVYWQAVETANAPHRKLARGEFSETFELA
jgi:hypothetical protein